MATVDVIRSEAVNRCTKSWEQISCGTGWLFERSPELERTIKLQLAYCYRSCVLPLLSAPGL